MTGVQIVDSLSGRQRLVLSELTAILEKRIDDLV
jgi:hypothetical protein